MTLFWVDERRDIRLTYEELVTELNKREERHPIVYTEDPSEVLIEILLSLLQDSNLTLLDSEFSRETLDSLDYEPDVGSEVKPAVDIQIEDTDELLSRIDEANADWTLTLYTSGTTGTPSQVNQTLDVLTRSVRKGERFDDHVWAFAYNPTHFAGLQVFFQAVSNMNPMIYIFEQSSDQIGELINQHSITHISATPTFYYLRLQQLSSEYPTVARLTSGGEKFESSLQESLREVFPNAKFKNVYATTEAGSVLESAGEIFRIPNKYSDKIRITAENELAIHQSLTGQSISEKINDGWFHTGDLVEMVDEDRFRFVGRESDFINVGGYQVNPHEVEKHINSVNGVKAAVVTARESSVIDNLLVTEIQPTADIDHDVLKNRVKEKINNLERWKQPRLIDVVKSIDQSRSGKRVRKEGKR